MQLHGEHDRHRDFTGHTCSANPDELTLRATAIAIARAEQALTEGRMLTPGEALALAGTSEARKDETLYSIARAVAWETGANPDEILCRLGAQFPELS
jgi:hypothetical protein